MNKEVLLSNNVFGTKVASSFMNKRYTYIYGLVLLALSLISSTIFYYQIIFNRIIALFPSVVLAIVLFLLTIKHQSSLENKRSIQEQIKRGIYFGSIIYIGIVSYLKIHGNYLNRVIGIINVVTNVSQITINAIVQVIPSIVLSIMFSIISYYLYKKARKRIKEDCKFEFQVSLKEEKKEKQIDNKEGKNLSVGFLYKVFP